MEDKPVNITPTIGRVLWYYDNTRFGMRPCAAVVAGVHDDKRTIAVAYWDHMGHGFSESYVPLIQDGDMIPSGPYCTWMPFQLGQAARYAADPGPRPDPRVDIFAYVEWLEKQVVRK